jgi:hypothetical protein
VVVTTPKLGLPKGEGGDSSRDYLKGAIAGGGLWHALEVLDNAILSTSSITLDNVTLNDPTIGPSEWTNANHTHASAATAGSTLGPGTTLSTPSLTTPGVSGVMTFGGDATLQRTGAGALRVDTHLGVGVNPRTWGGSYIGAQVGVGGALWSHGTTALTFLSNNAWFDGTNRRSMVNEGASELGLMNGGMQLTTAPVVAAGAVQTHTTRLVVAPTGTLTLTPDAGADALTIGTVNASINCTAGALLFKTAGNAVAPYPDGTYMSGTAGNRWNTVFSVVGTINTSSRDMKEGITPLSPERAMQAVRDTQPVTFDYVAPTRGPEWYDLPDDPEQAQKVLEDRLTAAPLEAAARHQHGFIAEDCDPLFLVGEGQTSPGSSIGVLLAALQQLDQRVQSLEGAA